jgi:beta-N-acetylhexosaminidase
VLSELRRVPSGFAAFLVLGAAVVTMIVLAAFDNTVAREQPAAVRPAAQKATPPVVDLAKGRRYPKARPAPVATPPPEQQPAPVAPATARVPLRRLIGQKLIVRMSGTSPSRQLLRRARNGQVGGVILFPENVGSAAQLRSLTRGLKQAAQAGGAAGFVIAVDQEGGPVKRLPAGPPNRAPAQIATPAMGHAEGAATGAYLLGLGVNVDLAPVLDVRRPGSFIASRSFAATPSGVASLGAAFAAGLQDHGVAATAKHFPGLGYARVNTDNGTSTVGASRAALEADLAPFARAVQNRIAMVMMSNASYPAFASGPAVLSRAVVQGQLRGRLHFGGVIVTDDLEAGAVRAVMPAGSATVAAAKAGADMLLLARSASSYGVAYRSLLDAVRAGTLDRASLEQSYARIQQLQSDFAH